MKKKSRFFILFSLCLVILIFAFAMYNTYNRSRYVEEFSSPEKNFKAVVASLRARDIDGLKLLSTKKGFNSLGIFLNSKSPYYNLENLAGALNQQAMPWSAIPVNSGEDKYSVESQQWKGPRVKSGMRPWRMQFLLKKDGWHFDGVYFLFSKQDLQQSLKQFEDSQKP